MTGLVRFGVSLDKDLLAAFDRLIEKKRYTNRSEALRDLIRQELVKKEWAEGDEVAGTITLVYDHHQRELARKLMNIQHDHAGNIVSTQHVHFDHHNCLEVITVKGDPRKIQALAETVRAVKGVKHVNLGMSTIGRHIR